MTDVVVTGIVVTGSATGGDGVGRLADGQAVFIRGALPGERVTVAITERRARFARAELAAVLEPSASRVAPACPLVAAGCGGCAWQHVEPGAQVRFKAAAVVEALERLGRVTPPEPVFGPPLAGRALRTTVRAAVLADDEPGRLGFRRHHRHDLVAPGEAGCLAAHPLVDEVVRQGRFGPPAAEVTVRASVATGERLAVVAPGAGWVSVPDVVVVVDAGELAAGHRAWLHEEVAGRRWRVSAGSFWQASAVGAEALVSAVVAAAAPGCAGAGGPGPRTVDLYGGVGLLGGSVAARLGGTVLLVESNRSAAADARVNLADLHGTRVVATDVRRWRPGPADLVIADPPRDGLGADVVDRICATGASRLVLVSCDTGSLGRDAGLLSGRGWRLGQVTVLDLFPHTAHVEVVTSWEPVVVGG